MSLFTWQFPCDKSRLISEDLEPLDRLFQDGIIYEPGRTPSAVESFETIKMQAITFASVYIIILYYTICT